MILWQQQKNCPQVPGDARSMILPMHRQEALCFIHERSARNEGKKEAELKAAEYAANKKRLQHTENYTIYELWINTLN